MLEVRVNHHVIISEKWLAKDDVKYVVWSDMEFGPPLPVSQPDFDSVDNAKYGSQWCIGRLNLRVAWGEPQPQFCCCRPCNGVCLRTSVNYGTSGKSIDEDVRALYLVLIWRLWLLRAAVCQLDHANSGRI